MVILIRFKKVVVYLIAIILLIIAALTTFWWHQQPETALVFMDEELTQKLNSAVQEIYRIRHNALLEQNPEKLDGLYQKDTRNSLWAYEHEVRKMKYLKQWSEKQSVEFREIDSHISIRNVKEKGEGYSLTLLVSTEYQYSYLDTPEILNSFRVGAYHVLEITAKETGGWNITKEWYPDPLSSSFYINKDKVAELQQLIAEGTPKDLSDLNPRRVDAVAYTDKYCGAASLPEYGFKYNSKYGNFNSQGGDCANFASQMLYEGGKFRKNATWNFEGGGGSKAWLNANSFNRYMLNSGRASVIAHGTYEQVLNSSYKLLPGDYVAYEKKGKVTHISVIAGEDSKGYALVNSHNADRYRVPWDMGWSSKGTKFYLVRVHY